MRKGWLNHVSSVATALNAGEERAFLAGLRKLGALGAIIGGGLRIVSSFVPWRADDAAVEALYGVV